MSGIVNLHSAITVRVNKQLDVIVQPNVEADRSFYDIDVAGISVVVAVRDAKRVLATTYRVAVIDREQAGWTSWRATSAHGRRLISWVIFFPWSLRSEEHTSELQSPC